MPSEVAILGQGEYASLQLFCTLIWFTVSVGCGFNTSGENSGYLSFPDHFSYPRLLQHSTYLYINATIPAVTVTFIEDVQQRIYSGYQGATGEPVVMATTALGLDWTYRARQEREVFAEWSPRRLRILRYHDSNLGCQVRCCGWQSSRGAHWLGVVRCLLTRWAPHHLRIPRSHHSNLGCQEWRRV